VDLDIVWNTIQSALPDLHAQVQLVLRGLQTQRSLRVAAALRASRDPSCQLPNAQSRFGLAFPINPFAVLP
jgi:hypothetical protein